jgi:hypothetical protein
VRGALVCEGLARHERESELSLVVTVTVTVECCRTLPPSMMRDVERRRRHVRNVRLRH